MDKNKVVEYDATYDPVFKYMMKEAIVASSLISKIINKEIKEEEIVYVDTEVNEGMEVKSTRFDIRMIINNKYDVEAEMQRHKRFTKEEFIERLVVYLSRLISESIDKNKKYDEGKVCYVIAICNFEINKERCIEEYYFKSSEEYKSKHRIIVIDLLKKDKCDNIELKRWLELMTTNKIGEVESMDKGMDKAKETILSANQDLVIRETLRQLDRLEIDEVLIRTSGYKEGKQESKLEMAKAVLNKNMKIEDIVEITGLNIEEIEKIKHS